MSITKQRAITIFDRFNGTILDVKYLDQQAAEPANYTSDDLFPIFDLVFKVPPGTNNFTGGLEWKFLTWFLADESNNSPVLRPQQFQRLIALPVLYFSTTTLGSYQPHLILAYPKVLRDQYLG